MSGFAPAGIVPVTRMQPRALALDVDRVRRRRRTRRRERQHAHGSRRLARLRSGARRCRPGRRVTVAGVAGLRARRDREVHDVLFERQRADDAARSSTAKSSQVQPGRYRAPRSACRRCARRSSRARCRRPRPRAAAASRSRAFEKRIAAAAQHERRRAARRSRPSPFAIDARCGSESRGPSCRARRCRRAASTWTRAGTHRPRCARRARARRARRSRRRRRARRAAPCRSPARCRRWRASAAISASVHGAPVAAGFGTSAPRLRSTASAGARTRAPRTRTPRATQRDEPHAGTRSASRRAMNVATSLGSVPRPKPAS